MTTEADNQSQIKIVLRYFFNVLVDSSKTLVTFFFF